MGDLREFMRRGETFGYDRAERHWWAHAALRLLLAAPRAYEPLVAAWDRRFDGARRALDALVDVGFADHQAALLIDTRTSSSSGRRSRPVPRYVATAKGSRLAAAVGEDIRALSDAFPQMQRSNLDGVAALLAAFNLKGSHVRHGRSVPSAAADSTLSARTARWWVAHLARHGYLRRLDTDLPDTRELIPAHYRPNRLLCRQLLEVLGSFPSAPAALMRSWRLQRSRFLDDIDPARVGVSGATDFDHDVAAQRILAMLLASPQTAADGVFAVEPHIMLPVGAGDPPLFDRHDPQRWVPYQPDAELREFSGGMPRRVVVEYERYQSRRDAWSHIERFLGWVSTLAAHPQEPAVLRFVVDSSRRARSYTELIEAFASYAESHPERMPPNPSVLSVADVATVGQMTDPADDRGWFRVSLPTGPVVGADEGRGAVLHHPRRSPYDRFFAHPGGGR